MAYQTLMPLTGAKPLCAALGNVGVGGRLSQRGAACATSIESTTRNAMKSLRSSMTRLSVGPAPPLIMIGVRRDVMACSPQIKVRRDRTNRGEGKPMRFARALGALGAVSILLL